MKEDPGVSVPLRKKKVLFVITKSNFGGAQRYVYKLAVRLKGDGFETAVALGGSGVLAKKLQEAGIDVFPISSAQRDISLFKEIKVLLRLYRIMRVYKPDILHLNSPKIGGLGAVAARIASVFNRFFGKKAVRHPISKIIYTNHGWPFREPRPEWQLVLISIVTWITVWLCDTTIIFSQTEKNDVKNWPLIADRLVVIPSGVKHFTTLSKEESLKKLVGEKRAEEFIKEGWLIVGTITELHRNKGLPFAIDGIDRYIKHNDESTTNEARAKTAYVIVGDGEERKNITELIRQKKLQNNVILTGPIDDARQYLTAFDIFLLASVKEGLPFTILEAGYAQIPIISTSVGAVPEVIQNLETGLLIHSARPQQITNALIYIEDHPEIKKHMSEALKKRIDITFGFEEFVKKIEALYLK